MRDIKFRAWVPPVTDGEVTLLGFMDHELGQQKVIAVRTETKAVPEHFGFEHAQLGVYFIKPRAT